MANGGEVGKPITMMDLLPDEEAGGQGRYSNPLTNSLPFPSCPLFSCLRLPERPELVFSPLFQCCVNTIFLASQ